MPRKTKSAAGESGHSEAVEAAIAKTTSLPAGEGGAPGAELAGGINEKIRQLIRLSKEQGYLTFDDINEALPESVENQEEIDNVLSILQNLEIEILEPDQVEDYKQRQEEAEEEEKKDEDIEEIVKEKEDSDSDSDEESMISIIKRFLIKSKDKQRD